MYFCTSARGRTQRPSGTRALVMEYRYKMGNLTLAPAPRSDRLSRRRTPLGE
jgi:hypothetical protein